MKKGKNQVRSKPGYQKIRLSVGRISVYQDTRWKKSNKF